MAFRYLFHTSVLLVTLLFLLTWTLSGCQQPQIAAATNAQGLAPVRYSGMDYAMADPRATFAAYRAVLIEPLGFSRLQIFAPADDTGRYGRFSFDEEDMRVLRSEYRRKVAQALGERDGYRIVATPDTGAADGATLRLQTELLKLEPNAPRERDEIGAVSARDRTFSKGAGSLTLEARLIDARTGEVVAVLRNEEKDDEAWGPNNPVTNRAAIIRAFYGWGLAVRRQLDAFAAPARE